MSALPANPLAARQLIFVGTGAIGRAIADYAVNLGMRRCVLIDPKRYKPASVASQCEPDEVGQPKVAALASRLHERGVAVTALAEDVCDIEPGYVEDGAVMFVSVDNRRGDIGANRLAWRMGATVIKANVEPTYLLGSVRCCELPGDGACLECAMTAAQYLDQRHPESCDGDEGRPTGSPRALCQLTGGAAALAAAQIVSGSKTWLGRQWQLNLLTGAATWSELTANPECRWDHGERWHALVRLDDGPAAINLQSLANAAAMKQGGDIGVVFSGRVTTHCRCRACGRTVPLTRWLRHLGDAIGQCECGGELAAVPFWTQVRLPASDLRDVWDQPLASWGVPARAVIALESAERRQVFVVGEGGGA